ncbi:glucan endo-1,3-beta-glucosidase 14-like isoform X2 [Momordica charantia]|uniref:glucan endo-1,3-beta-D-glucosidase n=1 Tax=Momordica charantia TaxID=3673 RepID=A0A6J1CUR5_MOMCH|nr:glucan endo-1,3-beta-glucosidase 14-like isoform X2 [Momordica charantia]
MMITTRLCFLRRLIPLLLVFFFTLASLTVEAFTGTYGINYGRIANNIPSPDKVVTLLRAAKIKNVRIYDADHSVLKAFSGTGLEIVISIPNEYLKDMSANEDRALNWVKQNVQPFLPETHICGIAIEGIYDPKTDLHYDNMLDAQIDAAYAALEDAGYKDMEVIVTETGWASRGDDNEKAATVNNAQTYNYNLRKRLAKKKGTPLRPKNVLKAYIFALFNENLKWGPTSERNYGLFKPDGSISYDIGFQGLQSSSACSPFSTIKEHGARGSYYYGHHISVAIVSAVTLLLFLQ